ncbi:MAG: efflux RND transporter permease subunit [bacterium]
MNLIEIIFKKQKAIIFLLIMLCIGGLFGMFMSPTALFPNVNFPRIRVSINSVDRPAGTMSVIITRPVEEILRTIPGVKNIRSTTSQGSTDIVLDFGWGRNMNVELLKVESAMNEVLPNLPKGTTFNAIRMYPTIYPVSAYSFTSNKESLVQLRNIALYKLKPLLLSVKGVSDIQVVGGEQAEYRVVINPWKLFTYNLTINDVIKALSDTNVIKSVGKLDYNYKLNLITSDTRLHNISSIEHTIIKTGKNGAVSLEDVATVTKGIVPQWTNVTADGKKAVLLQVIQEPDANTITINKDIEKKIHEFKKKMPNDIKIAKWYDQSKLIVASTDSLRDAIIIGIILAMLVTIIFLRNVKVILIIMALLPSVLLSTILLLYVFHMGFNIMTLGGIAAAVGLVIDDIIVMIENIMRYIETQKTKSIIENVKSASGNFLKPLLGSSLSTTIIFLPFVFISGITGAFFKSLSFTIAISLISSFLITWFAVPIIAERLLTEKDADKKTGFLMRNLYKIYGSIMRFSFKRTIFVYASIILLMVAGFLSYQHLSSGFMPSMDEGGFILDYHTPPGTSLTETNRILTQVQNIIQRDPFVETYTRRTGLQLGGGLTEPNTGDFFIRLKPFPRPPIKEIMNSIRGKIQAEVPGIRIEMLQLIEDMIGDLIGTPQPVEIKIYSNNGKLLYRLAPKVAALISKIPGIIEVKSGLVYSGQGINVKIDRIKAALEGITPLEATNELSSYLYGTVATEIIKSPIIVGVRVWTPVSFRTDIADIENIPMHSNNGNIFPLKRIAKIFVIKGEPEIVHENLKRMIAVTARIKGANLGKAIRSVKAEIKYSGILHHKDVYYSFGGIFKQQQKAFLYLALALVAAIILVFIMLLFLYEKFFISIGILFSALLGLFADSIGLFITHTQLNIISIMGIIITVGINTEMAIFYFSEYFEMIGNKNTLYSLISSGKNRLRPIIMSTLIAILALSPIAFNIGNGSAMLQPLAVAIISGLVMQLFIVLIVLPVIISDITRLTEVTSAKGKGL